jgi:thioredoxin reductase
MTSLEDLIIGAGPAGVQLGYFLAQSRREYIILEAGARAGTFFETFPRHRRLISINKVYTGYDDPEINLRWDWHSLLSERDDLRFTGYSKLYFPNAEDFIRYCGDFAERAGLRIRYGVRVVQILKDDGGFRVLEAGGDAYTCRRLIVATGVSQSYIPPIPGAELAERYETVPTDPDAFLGQRVLIVGKGNSGFETADNLIATTAQIHLASPHPVTMAWRSHFVGHLRAVNNNILDTYQLKSQNAVLNAHIDRIEHRDGQFVVTVHYTCGNGEVEDLVYDRVILCTGFRFDDTIFDPSCRPEMTVNGRFPNQTSAWESTNVADLYFAGTLMQMRDYRKSTSGFVHGFRYNVRALHRIFEQRYHGRPWPGRTMAATPEDLTAAVIDRVNRTSALWQQFGFLCDVLTVDGRTATHHEELPVDYVHDGEFGGHDHYYLVTLEYGPHHVAPDPFNVTRIERHDHGRANDSNFLHPVVRRFAGGDLGAEHHVIEDLQAEWREDVHVKPLLEFFRRDLAHGRAPAPSGPGDSAAQNQTPDSGNGRVVERDGKALLRRALEDVSLL